MRLLSQYHACFAVALRPEESPQYPTKGFQHWGHVTIMLLLNIPSFYQVRVNDPVFPESYGSYADFVIAFTGVREVPIRLELLDAEHLVKNGVNRNSQSCACEIKVACEIDRRICRM